MKETRVEASPYPALKMTFVADVSPENSLPVHLERSISLQSVAECGKDYQPYSLEFGNFLIAYKVFRTPTAPV